LPLTGGGDASGGIVWIVGSSEAAFGAWRSFGGTGPDHRLRGFSPDIDAALAYGDGSKGGRPPYDPVAMLKVLVLAAQNDVGDARMEYLIRDRLSWLRFLGFDLGAPTPDANTIRLFREKLTEAGALDALFTDFDRQLKERGYLAMGEQIVDATLLAAPKQIPWAG
jgi:transposase